MAQSARIMLVTSTLHDRPNGGRELLCKLNHDTLKSLYGENLYLVELPRTASRGIRQLASVFRGYIDGLDPASISAALALVQREGIGKVFVDGSNLGEFVRAVKCRFPDVEVTTFFHNVEARFFLGAFRQSKSLRALVVLAANYLAERKAVRWSDKRVALSGRDSIQLGKLYGRPATHVVPMALQDRLPADQAPGGGPDGQAGKYALFVGGVFYANQAGIAWFVDQVVPRIGIKVCIVGRGFEALKDRLHREGKVEVVGAVDSLAEWYLGASFVIAPILDGSGMKTKVAEALMFDKKVVGTPEAFSGYEGISDKAGTVCASAEEFVAAINSFDEHGGGTRPGELRALYEAHHSQDAYAMKMASVLSAS